MLSATRGQGSGRRSLFCIHRLAHVRKKAGVGGAASGIVCPGLDQAQLAIDREANLGRIHIFLPVILPPAHRAKRQRPRCFQRSATAARTAITSLPDFRQGVHMLVDESRGREDYTDGIEPNKRYFASENPLLKNETQCQC